MPTLPAFSIKTNINHSPHVVLLGAGASKAAFPEGDAKGKAVPLMCELRECLNLGPILKSHNVDYEDTDFESMYDDLVSSGKYPELVSEIESRVQEYFSQLSLHLSINQRGKRCSLVIFNPTFLHPAHLFLNWAKKFGFSLFAIIFHPCLSSISPTLRNK